MSDNFTSVLSVLSMSSQSRSEAQLQQLVDLTKSIKFFSGLSKSVHEECCKAMTWAQYRRGEAIFHYGEVPDSFRIILRGRVSVTIPTWTALIAASAINQSTPLFAVPRNASQGLLVPSRRRRKSQRPIGDCLTIKPESGLVMNEVTTLGPGTSFGELGLLRGDKRAATIVCKEDTVVAVLEKTDFDRILRDYQARILSEKINFLLSVPAFVGWTLPTMTKASYYFYERNYWKGDVVYREGEDAGEVFVIREGEFKFSKAVSDEQQTPLSPLTPLRSRPQIQLILKSSREVFGDVEVMEERARDFTCICTSKSALVYVTSKTDFLKRLQNSQTLTFLKDRGKNEKQWLQTRISGLLAVEKLKLQISERLIKCPTLAVEAPQLLSYRDFHSIRKDLLTFANIRHKRTQSDTTGTEKDALTFRFPASTLATERSVRAVSVVPARDKIAFALGTTRNGARLIRRKAR